VTVDAVIAREVLRIVQPAALEAAVMASEEIARKRDEVLAALQRDLEAYAHRCEAPNESLAIDAIAITHDIARRPTPSAGLGQLTGNPFCTWMCRHPQPQKLPPRMPQDQNGPEAYTTAETKSSGRQTGLST
jgi:hypothetical protein